MDLSISSAVERETGGTLEPELQILRIFSYMTDAALSPTASLLILGIALVFCLPYSLVNVERIRGELGISRNIFLESCPPDKFLVMLV